MGSECVLSRRTAEQLRLPASQHPELEGGGVFVAGDVRSEA
jgi:hypothetical protein